MRSPLRLAGAVLVARHDEWEAGDRRYFSESSMLELKTMNDPTVAVEEVTSLPELIAALTSATDLDRKSESTPLEGTLPSDRSH